MELKWVDQIPSPNRGSTRIPRFLPQMAALRRNPGKWANVVNYQKRYTAVNAATTFRNKGFQAAVRKSSGGWYRVYARFVE